MVDLTHKTNLEIKASVTEVKETVDKANVSNKSEISQLRLNSDNSLKMFESMVNSLKAIANGTKVSVDILPPIPTPQIVSDPSPSIVEVPRRKGLMFTSSLALETDIKKYEDEVNCELQLIPTHFIQENLDSKDPDSFLGNRVTQNLRGKTGFDFVILATGTNDISNLDLGKTSADLHSEVFSQTQTLFDIAKSLVDEMDINVFLVEKPPRYDSSSDQTCMKQKLSKYSNGVLASLIGATPKIFIVEQAGLSRASEKARSDIFKSDGLHLTKKGISFYNTNIINNMKECYPDTLQITRNDEVHQQGPQSSRPDDRTASTGWPIGEVDMTRDQGGEVIIKAGADLTALVEHKVIRKDMAVTDGRIPHLIGVEIEGVGGQEVKGGNIHHKPLDRVLTAGEVIGQDHDFKVDQLI